MLSRKLTASLAYLNSAVCPIRFRPNSPAGNKSEFHLRFDNYRACHSAIHHEKDYVK